MTRIALALCLALLASTSLAAMPAPKVVKINERIYALLGPEELPNASNHGYMVNTAAIIGDKGVVLVDTGFTDEIGKRLRQEIAKLTDKPVTHIINTHHHGDHTLGNIAFPGAKVISSQECKRLLEQTGYEWLDMVQSITGMQFPDTKPVLASVTYPGESRTEVTLEGLRMQLWVPKGSHTAGDLMVYLPEDQVLLAGDILVNEITPNFRDANVQNWIETLAQIGSVQTKTIVPGHGPLMTQAEVSAMHARMASLYAGVEEAYKEGLMDADVRERLDLSEWQRLKHFDVIMGGNISRAYLEVEQANF